MRLSVLVDNNSLTGSFYRAEHGLSFWIEIGEERILFDLGYSDAFLQNARKMGVDPGKCTGVVISHGHIDHTGGFDPLLKVLGEERKKEKSQKKRPRLILHPETLSASRGGKGQLPGMFVGKEVLKEMFVVERSREPLWITPELVFLGEVERQFDFEGKIEVEKEDGTKRMEDYLPEDSALAYRGEEGLVIVTGCSHAGICNIVEYARRVCGEERVQDIIGGFHLQNPSSLQMEKTREYIRSLQLQKLHACHCTDLYSKVSLAGISHLKEVGPGLCLEYF